MNLFGDWPARALSRRAFLGANAALALLGRRSWPRTAHPFATLINLRGGNDALNTLIPTRLTTYRQRRPTLAIAPENGASLDGGPYATRDYVLHPALASIARLYREGYVACVRLVGYPVPNQSHFLSQDIWSRGYRNGREADSGWIARCKDLYAPAPESVVALGLGSQLDFLGGRTPSTHTMPGQGGLTSWSNYRVAGDPDHPANEKLRYRVLDQILATPRAEPALERARVAQVAAIAQAERLSGRAGGRSPITYPQSALGIALESAAVLLRADFPALIFYSNHGDFDTHYDQGARQREQLLALDAAIDAFARDLQRAGTWQRTAIVVFSEFGRRNQENGDGTDHGEAGVVLVLGGAVRGGMFGPELREDDLRAENLPMRVDFRSVYAELLADHLGFDPAPVFDEGHAHTTLGLFL